MRRICIYMLEDALGPHNCLQLLQSAQQHALPVLATAAFGLAARCFLQVVASDQSGLVTLSQGTLIALLAATDPKVGDAACYFMHNDMHLPFCHADT